MQDETFEVEFAHLTLEGYQYFIPRYALHRPAVRKFLNGSLHEPDTHKFVRGVCKSLKGSIVHAGTFFGDMLPNFSKAVSGNVYAFEPVFENYILAKLCVDKNNLNNVILMNCALSNCFGNLKINTRQGDGRHAGGGSAISDNGEICASINIDRFRLEDVVLIHLDIEGHEKLALYGAQKTIQRCRPIIAIEDNNNNCGGFLRDIGYERTGIIQSLSIWSPNENKQYRVTVESLIS